MNYIDTLFGIERLLRCLKYLHLKMIWKCTFDEMTLLENGKFNIVSATMPVIEILYFKPFVRDLGDCDSQLIVGVWCFALASKNVRMVGRFFFYHSAAVTKNCWFSNRKWLFWIFHWFFGRIFW